MSSPVGTAGAPKPGAKVTDSKIAEIKKTFTPNQISKVQGFITSAVNDTLGSSLVGIKELFRSFSIDLLCIDALQKRQLFSLEKFNTTIEGETFIPKKSGISPSLINGCQN